jgi:KDO2-lipid IV(A) lauroyltransferase
MLSRKQPPVESLPLRLALNFFQSASPEAGLAIGRVMGTLAYYLLPDRRRIGQINLELAFGDQLDAARRRVILRRMWQNYGCSLVEFFRFPLFRRENIDRYVEWQGYEHLKRSVAAGRGTLVLTAHLGNWDLLALATGIRVKPVGLVAKTLSSRFWNHFLVGQRMETFVHSFLKRNSLREIIRSLRSNGIVGMVLDQDAQDSDGRVFVDFFGHKASTISSVAVLSQRLDLPILPMFDIRGRRGKHRILVLPPIEFEKRETLEQGILHNTRRYQEVLEQVIRRHPEQWNWVHRRWKRRPPGEDPIYD